MLDGLVKIVQMFQQKVIKKCLNVKKKSSHTVFHQNFGFVYFGARL